MKGNPILASYSIDQKVAAQLKLALPRSFKLCDAVREILLAGCEQSSLVVRRFRTSEFHAFSRRGRRPVMTTVSATFATRGERDHLRVGLRWLTEHLNRRTGRNVRVPDAVALLVLLWLDGSLAVSTQAMLSALPAKRRVDPKTRKKKVNAERRARRTSTITKWTPGGPGRPPKGAYKKKDGSWFIPAALKEQIGKTGKSKPRIAIASPDLPHRQLRIAGQYPEYIPDNLPTEKAPVDQPNQDKKGAESVSSIETTTLSADASSTSPIAPFDGGSSRPATDDGVLSSREAT